MRHAGAVADHIQAVIFRLQIVVDLDLHIIELDFDTVEQRIIIGSTGRNFVQRIDHLNDAVQNTLRNDKAQITRLRRKSRNNKALRNALCIGTASADQIAEALHDHTAAEHIGKPCDALAVAVGITERL